MSLFHKNEARYNAFYKTQKDYLSAMQKKLDTENETTEKVMKLSKISGLLDAGLKAKEDAVVKDYYKTRPLYDLSVSEMLLYPYTKEESEAFGNPFPTLFDLHYNADRIMKKMTKIESAYIILSEKYGSEKLCEPDDICLTELFESALMTSVWDDMHNDNSLVIKSFLWHEKMFLKDSSPMRKEYINDFGPLQENVYSKMNCQAALDEIKNKHFYPYLAAGNEMVR